MDSNENNYGIGDKALDYIMDKYGKTFIPTGYEVADYLSTTDVVHCYTDGMDPDYERVQILINGTKEEPIFSDTYFSYIIGPQCEKQVIDIVNKQFSDVKVYQVPKPCTYPDNLVCDSTLEDLYKEEPNYLIKCNVYIKGHKDTAAASYKLCVDTISSDLSKTGHSFALHIYIINEDIYDGIDRFSQDAFWDRYGAFYEVDGEKVFLKQNIRITNGEVR